MRRRLALARLVVGLLMVSCLCLPSCTNEGATPSLEEPTAPKVITWEEAVAIAQREVRARTEWQGIEVGSVNYESGCWTVFLQSVPAELGAHASVVVAADGKTVDYFAGR
jgi:hypothetical protein